MRRLHNDELNNKYYIIDNHSFTYNNEQKRITEVNIPSFIKNREDEQIPIRKIDKDAFRECTSLTTLSFQLANELTEIGSYAFTSTSLTNISFLGADSLTTIGNRAFYGCTSLTTVSFQVAH